MYTSTQQLSDLVKSNVVQSFDGEVRSLGYDLDVRLMGDGFGGYCGAFVTRGTSVFSCTLTATGKVKKGSWRFIDSVEN